jgi:hypothetical protein
MIMLLPFLHHRAFCIAKSDNPPFDARCTCGLREAWRRAALADQLREAVLKDLAGLADGWSDDAEFFEAGDEVHNRPRSRLRARKASSMEVAAEVARQCAAQLRAAIVERP